jgi:diguanylate cyclase (GGDEF)-like protein
MSVSALRIFIYSAVALFHLILFVINVRARKNVQPALSFAYLIFWTSVSVAGNISGQLLSPQAQADSLTWLYFSFGGAILAAPALVVFILNHLRARLGSRTIVRLFLHLPAIFLVALVFTNGYHQLVWNTTAGLNQAGFNGPLYYPALLITASYAVVALGLLLERFPKTERIYHLQYSLLMTGILVPVAVAVYTNFYNPSLTESLDLAIAGGTLMLLLSAFALLRLPLFGLLPIAQSELLRHVRDGFLITNPHQEVIFINPAAQKVLQISDGEALGKPLSTLIGTRTKRIIINTEMEHTSFELQVDDHYYHVNISDIKNRSQHIIGQIVMIYDVTAQTEFAIQFREQANKDELTNIYNRRYLLEQARIEFERARRYHLPFSIIMLDLDGLKRINDQYGHITGDTAIQAFSATCQAALRGSDTIGRFGGDEFLVLLPHTSASKAISIVDRLTSELEKTMIDTNEGPLRLSASFGISSLNEDTDTSLEELIKRADQALYLAKSDPKSCYAEVQAATTSSTRLSYD